MHWSKLIFWTCIIIIWIITSIFNLTNPLIIPDIVNVFYSGITFFTKDINSLISTFQRIIISGLVSSTIGITLGLIVGQNQILKNILDGPIDFLRSIPAILFFPLLMTIFEPNDITRILTAIIPTTLIMTINTEYGIRTGNKIRKEFKKLYKLSSWDFNIRVLLPGAIPHIVSGLRISISLTIVIILVTEMLLGSNQGLGQLLIISQYKFETEMIFFIIFLLGGIGYAINRIFVVLEKKYFHWR